MTAAPDASHRPGFFHRWNTCFSERFPPLQHGVLIAAFTFGLLSYTVRLGSSCQTPISVNYLISLATAFILILQLRILCEFKDSEEDTRWRPYQKVPRGLVSMPALRPLWFTAAASEAAGVLLPDAHLVLVLALIWGHSGLMGWNSSSAAAPVPRPLVNMQSHSDIVARELNPPTIVALPGLTRWLKDGDWVGTDGTTGIVVRPAPCELTTFSSA